MAGFGGFGNNRFSYKSDPMSGSNFNIPPRVNLNFAPPPPTSGVFANRSSNQVGAFAGPFNASVSQRANTSPQTFSVGANCHNDHGSGINASVSKTPSYSANATVGGSMNLHHSNSSDLIASAQHTEHFDNNRNHVGKSDSVGLQYNDRDNNLQVGVGATKVNPDHGKSSTNVNTSIGVSF